MTLHAYLTQPDHLDTVVKLIKAGVITDATIITHIRIYEDFMLMSSPIKKNRYAALGEKYKLNPHTISKIIRKLKNK